jgi:CrcB protein
MEMVIAVGFGGAAGAILRWLIGILTNNLTNQAVWGTLSVNLVGSFLVGFLFICFQGKLPVSDVLRTGILVGLLGGFTTFSTFSMETVNMMMVGLHARAMIYIVASVALCLAGTWVGVAVARWL